MAGSERTHDIDPQETREWLDALESVIAADGPERAHFLLRELAAQAIRGGIAPPRGTATPYVNTLRPQDEAPHPGDPQMEERILNLLRWNAMAMVVRTNRNFSGLGGHIATYASSANLYETGFNHFWHGPTEEHRGDLLYIQGHSSPGIYARAFLEGRLNEEQLEAFRREVHPPGISSYPHPWLMGDFWQFATVSMGLGPLLAMYQARFLKYLIARGLTEDHDRTVWAFLGDGETDEPESLGALTFAARERLDNLVFVINCNLQRLDGPVRGNGKIIQELESMFRGAGWNVIKVIWGSGWDRLLAQDTEGHLRRRMEQLVDGEYQHFAVHGASYLREHFFGASPELAKMVEDWSDEELATLTYGGHDLQKIYAAFDAARRHKGQPTVILPKTIKGYGMGPVGQGQNATHQIKTLENDDVLAFRDHFQVPIEAEKVADLPFYRPPEDSPERRYLAQRREELGGSLPARVTEAPKIEVPALEKFKLLLKDSGDREISTTMAFVRFLSTLVRDKELKPHLVPIVADEARTFGMEGMFKQLGIYSAVGQLYEPIDAEQLMSYREEADGQILQEGISEAGAFSSWAAAGTSYANHGVPMLPFFIFYSMFGFQRIGDLAWAAADMQARGFLLGATSGRTTLNGEGLQHQDGHSHLLAATNPSCRAYDPTYAYEVAVIMQDGMRRMLTEQENVFYYLTLLNENYHHPALPEGSEEGILKGMYLLRKGEGRKKKRRVQLLGSGSILPEVLAAADLLAELDVVADVWSVTSFTELRRDGLAVDRWNLLHPDEEPRTAYATQCLQGQAGPVIASTDYMKAFPDQIRAWVPGRFSVLGTDGFGRSDTREALRDFFEIDRNWVVVATLKALVDEGAAEVSEVHKAMKRFGIDPERPDPTTV
ncbi:MAG: pyruvate dehydrogenase (acetyl-transferring), homodimeric type [Acidobacteriota bacterium]|nr:pyruvate dehydrogenase (acetyl-transferring), homodimeric type [Acidobacteriota bacterium]